MAALSAISYCQASTGNVEHVLPKWVLYTPRQSAEQQYESHLQPRTRRRNWNCHRKTLRSRNLRSFAAGGALSRTQQEPVPADTP